MENSLNHKLNWLQSEIDQKFDNLHKSILRLANQHDHQEEENSKGECLIDTILGEQTQLQQRQEELMQEPVEALEELPAGEAGGGGGCRGKEAGEEPQKLIHHPIPINFDPSSTAQPKNSPLPVYILPTPAAQSTPKTPSAKTKANPSLLVQNLKKLVPSAQAFATASKTLATAHIAWHSGWFGCWFRFGAPGP